VLSLPGNAKSNFDDPALTARACNHALKGLGQKRGIAQDQFEMLG